MSTWPLEYRRSPVFARDEIAMTRGMLLLTSSGKITRSQSHCARTMAPAFELSFNRKGELASCVNGHDVCIGPQHTSLGFMNGVEGCSEYRAGDEVGLLSIWMEPATFNALLDVVAPRTELDFTSFLEQDYSFRQFRTDERENQILMKMERLLEDKGKGTNALMLEGCVLELLSLNMERLLDRGGTRGFHLPEADEESLYEARRILLDHLADPPSLLELSRTVHMNDCKLKSSFKRLFGTTVYGYVREQRLARAFALLCDGRHTVTQAAHAVGYSSVSHFSRIFQREYGQSPREALRADGTSSGPAMAHEG